MYQKIQTRLVPISLYITSLFQLRRDEAEPPRRRDRRCGHTPTEQRAETPKPQNPALMGVTEGDPCPSADKHQSPHLGRALVTAPRGCRWEGEAEEGLQAAQQEGFQQPSWLSQGPA